MTELEARRIEIETKISNADTPPPLLHPNMAGYYRDQVSKLRDALDHPDNRTEAADILRTLIDRIELKPIKVEGKRTLAIDLHGHLAGILSLANKAKGGIGEDVAEKCTTLVAGGKQAPRAYFLESYCLGNTFGLHSAATTIGRPGLPDLELREAVLTQDVNQHFCASMPLCLMVGDRLVNIAASDEIDQLSMLLGGL